MTGSIIRMGRTLTPSLLRRSFLCGTIPRIFIGGIKQRDSSIPLPPSGMIPFSKDLTVMMKNDEGAAMREMARRLWIERDFPTDADLKREFEVIGILSGGLDVKEIFSSCEVVKFVPEAKTRYVEEDYLGARPTRRKAIFGRLGRSSWVFEPVSRSDAIKSVTPHLSLELYSILKHTQHYMLEEKIKKFRQSVISKSRNSIDLLVRMVRAISQYADPAGIIERGVLLGEALKGELEVVDKVNEKKIITAHLESLSAHFQDIVPNEELRPLFVKTLVKTVFPEDKYRQDDSILLFAELFFPEESVKQNDFIDLVMEVNLQEFENVQPDRIARTGLFLQPYFEWAACKAADSRDGRSMLKFQRKDGEIHVTMDCKNRHERPKPEYVAIMDEADLINDLWEYFTQLKDYQFEHKNKKFKVLVRLADDETSLSFNQLDFVDKI